MLEPLQEQPPQAEEALLMGRKDEIREKASTSKFGIDAFSEESTRPSATHRPIQSDSQSLQCPKCFSPKIIPGLAIRDQGEHSNGKLSTFVDAAPDALIFKNRLYSKLFADICGECGHVELRAENPGDLYNHYLQSKLVK
jgi:hypothetical protein